MSRIQVIFFILSQQTISMLSLYRCTSCNELIQPTKARLSCASCAPRLTLCANCYVVQNYPLQHQENPSHSILLHAKSGFIPIPPPPPPHNRSRSAAHMFLLSAVLYLFQTEIAIPRQGNLHALQIRNKETKIWWRTQCQ